MEKELYYLGKRDAIAEMFMLIRNQENIKQALFILAGELKAASPDNAHPHADWFIKNEGKL